jgi:hypothetical protein
VLVRGACISHPCTSIAEQTLASRCLSQFTPVIYDSSKIYIATIPLELEKEGDGWELVWEKLRADLLTQLEKQKSLTDDEVAIVVSGKGETHCEVSFDPATSYLTLKTKGDFDVYHDEVHWELD